MAGNDIFLRPGAANPNDVILRDPLQAVADLAGSALLDDITASGSLTPAAGASDLSGSAALDDIATSGLIAPTAPDLSGNAALGDVAAAGTLAPPAPDISGTATLGDITAAGALAPTAPDLSGNAALGDVAAAGTLASDLVELPPIAPAFASSGGGPDAQVSMADYLKRFGRQSAIPAEPAAKPKRTARQRQAMEEEILQLCQID